MFFQPRIFISSLLKWKLETREEIKKILEDCGATVLMYEKNLTPSMGNYTYTARFGTMDEMNEFVDFVLKKEIQFFFFNNKKLLNLLISFYENHTHCSAFYDTINS